VRPTHFAFGREIRHRGYGARNLRGHHAASCETEFGLRKTIARFSGLR
jgi:hypothetical protein